MTQPPDGNPESTLDIDRMATPVGVTLVLQVFRLASALVVAALITRSLGPGAFGLLTLSLTLSVVLATIASLGTDQGVVYFVARATAKGDRFRPSAPDSIRAALLMACPLAILGATAVWLGSNWIAEVFFDDPRLAPVLSMMVVCVPLSTVLAAALGGLQGIQRVSLRSVLEFLVFPGLTLVFAVGVVRAGFGIRAVAGAYVAAWAITCVLAVALALRIRGPRDSLPFRGLLVFSLPLMMSILLSYLLLHVDSLMLGALATVEDVGLYGVASRLALPLILVLDSVNRAFSPMVAHLHHEGAMARLESLYAMATEWLLAIDILGALALWLYSEALLSLFGPEFVAAASALVVLSSGLLVAAVFGASGYMLIMTGHPRLEMADNVLLLAANVLLNWLLIPRWGLLGAASATGLSMGGVHVLKALQVRWILGMQPFRRRTAMTLVLALAAALPARFIAHSVTSRPIAGMIVGIAVMTVIYVPAWWSWGASDASHDVLGGLFVKLLGRRRTDPGRR